MDDCTFYSINGTQLVANARLIMIFMCPSSSVRSRKISIFFNQFPTPSGSISGSSLLPVDIDPPREECYQSTVQKMASAGAAFSFSRFGENADPDSESRATDTHPHAGHRHK
jgi:hypothetical protein